MLCFLQLFNFIYVCIFILHSWNSFISK
jgi:hypothetical protein